MNSKPPFFFLLFLRKKFSKTIHSKKWPKIGLFQKMFLQKTFKQIYERKHKLKSSPRESDDEYAADLDAISTFDFSHLNVALKSSPMESDDVVTCLEEKAIDLTN